MHPTKTAYAELQQAYDHFNRALFRGQLPNCLITLQREKRTFGYFSSIRFVSRVGDQTDEIAMNPSYFGVRPVRVTLSTLVHEMVHAWQAHFGKPSRAGYHNMEWAEMMDRVGLVPSNTGKPGGKRVGQQMTHYIADGGEFDRACAQLLTTEFTLSWLDRFPPCGPDAFGVDGGNEGDDAGEDDETAAVKHLLLPLDGIENRTNRVKYRCPNCAAQVWGKPNLLIACGEIDCAGAAFEVA
ncbi:zinc metalloprotease [Xanthomonas perforans]|uniref:SprT-like domain-containing protein n=3 Tax=Xanthomonas TaxID=338 RepID=UPI00062D4771|nr:SprT-like domain-containing protein [Xanthomonas perforans]KLD35841.1 zinc metalloprotease [Xanthomonas perforans]MBZ2436230.1 SprT-like domain-containing protein [Xanthomonas perforans]MBZ2461342.1 SprT-like domain-containing protein [Xanthomonas perforans]MBZ2482768.1 SprT-like domain-containing protein [Xanthomonas perforans]MBZ2491336.1 SprT-like domain-containing protein [Xanthomonas perforans]